MLRGGSTGCTWVELRNQQRPSKPPNMATGKGPEGTQASLLPFVSSTFEYPKSQIFRSGFGDASSSVFSNLMSRFTTP